MKAFTGWGRTSPTVAENIEITGIDSLRAAIAKGGTRGLIARGLGRSYGDAAQNGGGAVLDMTGWNEILGIDTAAETVTVQSGVSIDQLMRHLLPHGLWLPVIPGTRQVTIGGAIAADVHGKNHHHSGSFGTHVRTLELLTASGDLLSLDQDDPLFWATVGGMGLTGVVTQATIGLKRVKTSSFLVDTLKVNHLDELLEALATGDDSYEYSVAWFDTATSGRKLGRAVITRGHVAQVSDLPDSQQGDPLRFNAPQLGRVPFALPHGLVNNLTARAFNAAWFAKAPRRRDGEVQDITQFFHPLDIIGEWNRVYGAQGFCQYQFVVPFGTEDAFREAVTVIADSDHVSSLNVLKRFGSGNRAPLSFPIPGWTLAVDLPIRRGLSTLLDRLDQIVLEAQGRVYLAKDSRLSPQSFRAMYPRFDEFESIRATIDPDSVFRSDLARRLQI